MMLACQQIMIVAHGSWVMLSSLLESTLGGARFRHAAVGGRRCVDLTQTIRSPSLLPLVCLCTNDCRFQLQLWALNRLQKKPLEVGRALLSLWLRCIGHERIAAML
jgi:hypothetical protein